MRPTAPGARNGLLVPDPNWVLAWGVRFRGAVGRETGGAHDNNWD